MGFLGRQNEPEESDSFISLLLSDQGINKRLVLFEGLVEFFCLNVDPS